ncbi:hypothetical protein AAFF_G00433050 [Aldrovandia affinis]|uniref:Uncharacterized protein n=1 Tax=Aldrovandia affinis TaxID=143900 RepID=A0AAD7S8N7_9TELE|nr:hypothetical protein AAFF_G00433050 [Aldrovandia affinis]
MLTHILEQLHTLSDFAETRNDCVPSPPGDRPCGCRPPSNPQHPRKDAGQGLVENRSGSNTDEAVYTYGSLSSSSD